jgi:thiamine-phosphate pyrophosphorylase
VNDRADIARLAGADGVHVGQDDLSPAAVRTIVGTRFIVGRSTHTTEQVHTALTEPITYIAIGPVFGTATKDTGYTAVGVEAVRDVSRAIAGRELPIVAIGGITIERVERVVESGAAAVAVITDLLATGDPTRRVRDYLARLSKV